MLISGGKQPTVQSGWVFSFLFPSYRAKLLVDNSDLPSSSSIISWGCRDTQTRDYFRSPGAVAVPGLLEIPICSRECLVQCDLILKHTVEACTVTPWMSPIVTGLSEIDDIFRLFFFFFWWRRKRQKFHKTVLSFTGKYSGCCYSIL